MADDEQKTVKFHISEGISAGRFANICSTTATHTEVVIDAAYLHPSSLVAEIVSRVILTPSQFKAWVMMLTKTLEQYEAAHGVISEMKKGPLPGPRLVETDPKD